MALEPVHDIPTIDLHFSYLNSKLAFNVMRGSASVSSGKWLWQLEKNGVYPSSHIVESDAI